MKAISFPVTVGTKATTGITQVTATLINGIYVNVWTGPFSTTGSLAFLAGTGLPPNYAAGFWVAVPVISGTSYFFVPTLKTYPDGRLCFSAVDFRNDPWGYADSGPYFIYANSKSCGGFSVKRDEARKPEMLLFDTKPYVWYTK